MMADVKKTPTKSKNDKITTYFSPSPKKSLDKAESDSDYEKGTKLKDVDLSSPFLTPKSTPTKHTRGSPSKQSKDVTKDTINLASKKLSEVTETSDDNLKSNTDQEAPPTVGYSKQGRRGRRKKEANTPSQPKPKTAKKRNPEPVNRVLTDYFPVRRSDRRTKTVKKEDAEMELHEAVLSGREDGLEVVDLEGKGRGVVACKSFKRGDYVIEYAGDLISVNEARKREAKYSLDSQIGCYMYYFNFKNKNYCIDATAESGKLGRLLNHSTKGNCRTKLIGIQDKPYLILVASNDIEIGQELLYDYGDRSKSSIESHPWLKL